MSSRFSIAHRTSHGNLHISPQGVFDGNCARELIHLIGHLYKGTGRIFIDTHRIDTLCPLACHTFKTRMDLKTMGPGRLYFKGPKGFKLAPHGSRVLVVARDAKKRKGPKRIKPMVCRTCPKNMAGAMEE